MADQTDLIPRFEALRDRCIQLKEDRSTYIKSRDVLVAYDELCTLLQAREAAGTDGSVDGTCMEASTWSELRNCELC